MQAKQDSASFIRFKGGQDLNKKDYGGNFPIHLASRLGHTDAVLFCLDQGQNIDIRTDYDSTPLMLAADHGHTDTVRALLQRGADVQAKNNDGWTALMHAGFWGLADSVDLLLAAGADPAAKSNVGQSIIEWSRQYPAIVDKLEVALALRLRQLLQELLVPLPPDRPYFAEEILDEIVQYTIEMQEKKRMATLL
jgi:ankyrin repeat protein